MTDDKVKAREFFLYEPNDTCRRKGAYIYARKAEDARPIGNAWLKKPVHVVEMSAYLALQSELKHERESYNRLHENYCDEVETLTKERDGLRRQRDSFIYDLCCEKGGIESNDKQVAWLKKISDEELEKIK